MRSKLGRARQALYRLADTIQSQDEIFLEAFNQEPLMLQDFTDSRALVLQATAQLQPSGGTALYDAVLDGLRRIKQGRRQKKALVVITDGLDTASRASLAELTASIHGAGVLVYTIGIGNPIGSPQMLGPGAGMGPFPGPPGRLVDGAVDSHMLSILSEETGAKHFLLNTSDVLGSRAVLETAAQTIATELRRQYSLGYHSPLKGNVYRDVRVETRRAGVIVRTQKGID
jgi:VWFA-related protein